MVHVYSPRESNRFTHSVEAKRFEGGVLLCRKVCCIQKSNSDDFDMQSCFKEKDV